MQNFALNIPQSKNWTDEDLFQLCTANKGVKIERDSQGCIIVMSPSGGLSSHYISLISAELVKWNDQHGKPGITFESSGGFLLGNGAMRAPNAAWLSRKKWDELTKTQKLQFPPVCPEFVIEVRSPSDQLQALQHKMKEWLDNGSLLAWLIDPKEELTYVYHPDQAIQTVTFDMILSGEDLLPGFYLKLHELLAE